jgi:hypothetical protein
MLFMPILKKEKDIIRVYNMHLQSLKLDVNEISENIDVINKDKSQMLLILESVNFATASRDI